MYLSLFLTFLRIGAFTIGGGYAMLPLIEREAVGRKWMSREEFVDVLAVAQAMPGIFAVNIAIFIGYRLKKTPGSIVCCLAAVLPSFLMILTIALCFAHIKDNAWVDRMFRGIRPVVVALIAVPCLSAAKTVGITWQTAVIPIAAALLIWQMGVSPVYIVLLAAAGGWLYGRLMGRL
ncbi:MAG: chromate transporter [Tannerellaceae bacterium]|jgi:chromate transporter|nr:chromate transporter [Tannerellaceae bacterium]